MWERVWEVLSKNTSQWRGPCSRPGSSSGAHHWPVAVKKLHPPHRLTIGLVAHAQDDFGGTVVAGDYVGRHEEAGGGCPGQAKVQDLQCAVGLHHDVAGFKVLDRKHNTNLINTQVVLPVWYDMVVFCSERCNTS